ncbi:MAG: pyridoxamine 5'-phosphate oxidase family protein, partial [Solirubrobacterales bacterium]
MADFDHPDVKELLAEANFAVVSSHNPDGSILSTVTWIDYADGVLAVNSMVGRAWPSNLERDPQITALV